MNFFKKLFNIGKVQKLEAKIIALEKQIKILSTPINEYTSKYDGIYNNNCNDINFKGCKVFANQSFPILDQTDQQINYMEFIGKKVNISGQEWTTTYNNSSMPTLYNNFGQMITYSQLSELEKSNVYAQIRKIN